MGEIKEMLVNMIQTGVLPVVLLIVRLIVPVLTFYVVWRSYTSFRKGQRRRSPVIMLADHNAKVKFPILYWENSIGRSKSCDVVLEADQLVSRDHAVLMRREEGWLVCDTGSKTGVFVNGKKVEDKKRVEVGDDITIGATTLTLLRSDKSEEQKRRMFRGFSREAASPAKLMFVATLVHLLMTLQMSLAGGQFSVTPFIPFLMTTVIGWSLYIYIIGIQKRVNFEIETVAYLLSGIGILLMSSYDETLHTSYVQIAAMVIGIVILNFLIWFMGDLERVEKFKMAIGIGAIVLFILNLVLGRTVNGSRNWIFIGSFSIQPSEFIKIAFIFFGASTLDKLQTEKNITQFLIFSGICMAFLFIMKDFGTALIFFAAFLIIAFMRSGSIRTIILVIAAALIGIVLILRFKPHVANRFESWGHIWEAGIRDDGGFQQTRMLTYLASGGLLGVGLGEGYFAGKGDIGPIFAAENDLVFGFLCEEQGLLLGLVIVIAIAMFTLYARSDVTRSRSTFFSIVSCAAAGLLLFQASLNVFGATDIIPFTGVTLPFISAGGSSMMSVWGMLAFLKAADERTYAVRRQTRKQAREEEKTRIEREEEAIKQKIRQGKEQATREQEWFVQGQVRG
ncbi:FtsW/RodA/SpoVE family cell cycle protein [Scatolibacter rhodanostii]|uniref:FtsW/RodA/SpoVE family cell cycle protein n=1 Tax=Scatolibacter rhodanostii TaxID=2014781 RepID=UPI001FA92884|nr:FtsW/RodA/SpoVE family cell cycle protein [Scatolibacter rhodanostii]